MFTTGTTGSQGNGQGQGVSFAPSGTPSATGAHISYHHLPTPVSFNFGSQPTSAPTIVPFPPTKKAKKEGDEMTSPYLSPNRCEFGCQGTIKVGELEFYPCRDHLCRISPYFRSRFIGNGDGKVDKIEINDQSQSNIKLYLEATDPDPETNKIKDASVPVLMSLADKFETRMLKVRLCEFVVNSVDLKDSSTLLTWLLSSLSSDMDENAIQACAPGVACLPLSTLMSHKEQIGQIWYPKLLEAKLKAVYKMSEKMHSSQSSFGAQHCVYKCPTCNKQIVMSSDMPIDECQCMRKVYKEILAL